MYGEFGRMQPEDWYEGLWEKKTHMAHIGNMAWPPHEFSVLPEASQQQGQGHLHPRDWSNTKHPKAWLVPHLVGGLEHLLFFHILWIIIPTDFHIFQRDWNHQPVGFKPCIGCYNQRPNDGLSQGALHGNKEKWVVAPIQRPYLTSSQNCSQQISRFLSPSIPMFIEHSQQIND